MNGLTAPTSNMSHLEKWSMINQTLNKRKIAILALQETHLDEGTKENILESFGKKMTIINSPDPDRPRASAGVAFVINNALITPKKITENTLLPGRAIMIEIDWLENEKTTILNIYAPNNRSSHQTFWTRIEEERNANGLTQPDFTLGDFNITEEPIDRIPQHLDDAHAIEALRDIRHNWDIQDGWRQTHPDEREYTYRATMNNQHIKSHLDRIYIKKDRAPLAYEWDIRETPVPTDHWLAIVKYSPKSAPKIGQGRWTFPLQLRENKTLMKAIVTRGIKLQNDLENLKLHNTDRELSNPQRLWREYKGFIKVITKATMKETYHKINSKINALEKDRKDTIANPDFDSNSALQRHEAYLAHEITFLERKRGKNKKETLQAELVSHGEKLGGIWSAMSKEKKPRDLIRRLKVPNSTPPKFVYNSKRMAELAREYHNNLQEEDAEDTEQEELNMRTDVILEEIPETQTLTDPLTTTLNQNLTEVQVRKALHLAKNGSATGLDGCPYELWKKLSDLHDNAQRADTTSFDIIKVLTEVMNDIQDHGVDERTDFSIGWMCPVYKKKDPADISNYRPITLLNTDYKLLTKALAIQLTEHAASLIHPDQAGFIPKRTIFNHIRLAKAIIDYAEATDEDGAIIALDQEKAYDRIKHEYLWKTLEAFNLPECFIKTAKALYQNAETKIAINGFLSDPYKIKCGIRQGDPLSCLLFNLGIEPLACMIRNEPNLQGFRIPGVEEPIKINLFADDTNLFLSKEDRFDTAQSILTDWCKVSGAKFNIEKTEIIPIGSEEHRRRVITTRKVNQNDMAALNTQIRIAEEGEAVRSLGAWVGNHTNDASPWEALLDKINKNLKRWGKSKPTMMGRVHIIQAIVGGHTQFLTKAQGMPKHIESAITKIIRNFMWEDDSSPRIALDILQ